MQNKATSRKIPWKGVITALIFSLVALALVFSKIAKPVDVLRELEHYPLAYFLAAVLTVLGSWLIDGQRIGALTEALGHHFSWWHLGLLLAAANFLTLVTPFAGGGGALIIYFLYRRGLSSPKATAVVITGGLASQISLASLAVLVLPGLQGLPAPFGKHLLSAQLFLLAYIGVLIGLLYLAGKSKRLARFLPTARKEGGLVAPSKSRLWLAEFQETCRGLLGSGKRFYFRSLLVSFLYYLVYYFAGFILLSGFGAFTGLFNYGVSVLLGIAPVFSPIPGGAGAAELVAYFVLEKTLARDVLATFIVLWRAVVFYIPILIGGSIFAFFVFQWSSGAKEKSAPAGNITERE